MISSEGELIICDNNYYQEKNEVGVQDESGRIFMVPVTEDIYRSMISAGAQIDDNLLPDNIRKEVLHPVQLQLQEQQQQPPKTNNLNKQQKTWFRDSILALIAEYKDLYPQITNSSTRNSKVWTEITLSLSKQGFQMSSNQCKDKFSKLKCMYQKTIDARKSTNSGGVPVRFEYFTQMDEIFCESHANELPGKVTSSAYINRVDPEVTLNNTVTNAPITSPSPVNIHVSTTSRRITVGDAITSSMDKLYNQREKANERKMALLQKKNDLFERSIDEHNKLMTKILEKL